MKVTMNEAEKLLKGNHIFEQLGFSMLLARLKKIHAQDESPETLEKCAEEINAFLDKFMAIMSADCDVIEQSVKPGKCLLTLEETKERINSGKVLHIAGTEALLQELPKGNWIGGSTEYFMTEDGGIVSGELLYVTEIECEEFSIKAYGTDTIAQVANDAYDNGFTIVIVPADSKLHIEYAENAMFYENLFMRNIVGWIAGRNITMPEQKPIAVNGTASAAYPDKAVALHIKIPENQKAAIKFINIFQPDENSPIIEFTQEGFSAVNCLIDGKETAFADYIAQNSIDTKLPLIGDYSGNGINISFKSIEKGVVTFYAPVFNNIKYRTAKQIPDYVAAFHDRITAIEDEGAVFSCNCILNFLFGELEGKTIERFTGPVTFGEILYQLLNQTLVYVTIID